jgi:hypothetical protein
LIVVVVELLLQITVTVISSPRTTRTWIKLLHAATHERDIATPGKTAGAKIGQEHSGQEQSGTKWRISGIIPAIALKKVMQKKMW